MLKLKTKLQTFFRSKITFKIFACCLIFGVLCSCFLIPSFAAEQVIYQSIAPVQFYNFSGNVNAVAFPGAHAVTLYYATGGVASDSRSYLNNQDYFNEQNTHILYKSWNGNTSVPYFKIQVICNYSSIYVNGVTFTGSTSVSSAPFTLQDVYSFESSPVTSSYVSGTSYYYNFDIILTAISSEEVYNQGFEAGQVAGYESGYEAGSSAGYNTGYSEGYLAGSQSGSDLNYQKGYDEGYDVGFGDGRDSTDSENLGQNLLGDTLNMPFKAMNDFIIYESANGFQVTLGLVVGGAISMTLFIAFLKMFAGG